MREPLIIGHRGASAVALENTIAAFHAAIVAGADGIEFDVRLSRDGVPVIIHDDTLSRTHGVRRRVADMTMEELSSAGVASLRELFELMTVPLHPGASRAQTEATLATARRSARADFLETAVIRPKPFHSRLARGASGARGPPTAR